jgi:ATP-dependent DNA ligase
MADYIVHKAIELDNLSAKARAAITETEWIISPKYDGCHAVFCFVDGKHLGTYSRSGEVVRSMDHIARSLPDHYDLSTGRIAVCGEAWMLGKEFNEISGAFRRHTPQPDLAFVPFDIVPFDYNDQGTSGPVVLLGQYDNKPYPTPYIKRLSSLKVHRIPALSNVLLPTSQVVFGTLEEVLPIADTSARHYKASTLAAYDGTILAQANGRYQVGSGKGGEFIKCKPLISETVTCNAVFPATGEKTGKNTLALGFSHNGLAQKVSTGLTQEQVDEFINDPSLILRQRIEVEAMGITVNGFFREPRFKGIRTDA